MWLSQVILGTSSAFYSSRLHLYCGSVRETWTIVVVELWLVRTRSDYVYIIELEIKTLSVLYSTRNLSKSRLTVSWILSRRQTKVRSLVLLRYLHQILTNRNSLLGFLILIRHLVLGTLWGPLVFCWKRLKTQFYYYKDGTLAQINNNT